MRRALVLMALLPVACGSGGDGDQPPAGTARWTVLVYMMADNNLEPSAVDDLNEMMTSGSTDEVNWVVEADRHEAYSDDALAGIGDWTGTKRLIVRKGTLEQLSDLGETDQASPASLAAFISWGIKTYPAQRHALVMWNHGMAWPGFGHDEKSDTHLNLAQLAQGIGDGLNQAGVSQLDLLGFDACLMANLEVAHELADLATYQLASEETEPGHGWDYAAISSFLASKPAASALELGRTVVDSYPIHAQAQNAQTARSITLSLIESAKLAPLVQAVESLASELTPVVASRQAWMPVAISRMRSEQYGRTGEAASSSNVVDLRHLTERLAFYGTTQVSAQIGAVQSALDEAVVHSVSSELRPHASGLTVYFPTAPQVLARRGTRYGSTRLGQGSWKGLLDAYATTAQSDTTAPTLGPLDYFDDQGGLQVSANLSGQLDDVAEAYFFLGANTASGVQIMGLVPALPQNNVLATSWDYKLPVLSCGSTSVYASVSFDFSNVWDVLEQKSDVMTGQIPIQLQGPDAKWYTGFIRVSLNAQSGAIALAGTYLITGGGMSQVRAEAGKSYALRMLYPMVQTDGSMGLAPDAQNQLSFSQTPLTLSEVEAPQQSYTFGFLASDLSGNSASAAATDTL